MERVPNAELAPRRPPPGVAKRTQSKKANPGQPLQTPRSAVETLRRVLKGETLSPPTKRRRSLPHARRRRSEPSGDSGSTPSSPAPPAGIAISPSPSSSPASSTPAPNSPPHAPSPPKPPSPPWENSSASAMSISTSSTTPWTGLLRRQPGIEQRLARRHLHARSSSTTSPPPTACPLARRGYSRGQEEQAPDRLRNSAPPKECPIAVLRRQHQRPEDGGLPGGQAPPPLRPRPRGPGGRSGHAHRRPHPESDLAASGAALDHVPARPRHQETHRRQNGVPVRPAGPRRSKADDFPGERLIVCRNPRLAVERRRKRQELLAATEKSSERFAPSPRGGSAPHAHKSPDSARMPSWG